jgi:outer membrane protein OmpA-like peptidoglycan-associated protein
MAGSQGKIQTYRQDGQLLSALLCNFDLGGSHLKPAHQAWLDEHVVPRFRKDPGTQITVYGYACRSSRHEWKESLAWSRAYQVVNYLVRRGIPETAVWEQDIELEPYGDNSPIGEQWRAAVVECWA